MKKALVDKPKSGEAKISTEERTEVPMSRKNFQGKWILLRRKKLGMFLSMYLVRDISLFTGIDKFSYQNSTLSHPGNNFSSYQYECGLTWVLLTQ